jgi:hypothetical protein
MKTKFNKLLNHFYQIKLILNRESENNWIRGIDLIIENIESQKNDESLLDYVDNTFRTMLSGNGSFSDFYIWREDREERIRDNNDLEELKISIFNEIDSIKRNA